MKKIPSKNISFILFGATGDLAIKKIFPALESLCTEGALGSKPQIIAVGRRDWKTAEFVEFLRASGRTFSVDFLKSISYSIVDMDAGTGYDNLKINDEAMFYISLAPDLHIKAITGLRDAGLLKKAKLLIEKPFGTDEKSAKKLDAFLGAFLDEDQIFRVDHYLGKDTVRAMMDLHENAPGLSALITSESVSRIRVRIFEEKGIDGRGASYDGVGAFRDVGQNHMLEMLAVISAEVKKGKESWSIARARALEHLAPPVKTCALSRRAQYDGYHAEKGVSPKSETETAFEVVTNFSAGKLAGIPLILESGKKMDATEAFVEINFKEIEGLPQRIVFRVQPESDIVIENWDGSAESFEIAKTRDAYGNVIFDALQGERRTFVGREEIEALWRYADRVVACWNKVPLEKYGKTRPFLLD